VLFDRILHCIAGLFACAFDCVAGSLSRAFDCMAGSLSGIIYLFAAVCIGPSSPSQPTMSAPLSPQNAQCRCTSRCRLKIFFIFDSFPILVSIVLAQIRYNYILSNAVCEFI